MRAATTDDLQVPGKTTESPPTPSPAFVAGLLVLAILLAPLVLAGTIVLAVFDADREA